MPHDCPVGRCYWPVPDDRLMCPPHWHMVPLPLRREVWRAWDHGAGAGSKAHRDAMLAAVAAVEDRRSGISGTYP